MHLVWHRAELRLHDQPALHAAASSGQPVVPLVILDSKIFSRPDLTPRRRAWFCENVRALRESYRALGSDLIAREGEPAQVLAQLAQECKKHGAPLTHAHFVKNYTPYAKARDAAATRVLEECGVRVQSYGGQYTHEPGTLLTQSGGRYGVFGAFKKRWEQATPPTLMPRPKTLPAVPAFIARGEIPDYQCDITLPPAGEAAALARLEQFLSRDEAAYAQARNFPAQGEGSAGLSYYFNIGALSPRYAVQNARDAKWRFELTWWDFFADLLDRIPESTHLEMRPEWRGFPWRRDDDELARWRNGETGFPIVDAGMRELCATGFMHNRVRMITASFLCKHLLIDWRCGEAVFRGWLLDGETSQNTGNWQWVAGSGCDAAPYFRVFNPVSQGEKCDPRGDYVRRWVPELEAVENKFIHQPWKVAKPPQNYPAPMIELDFGRDRFLTTAKAFLRERKLQLEAESKE